MTRVRVAAFGVSIDGFSAGPEQSLENPLGVNGLELFESFFATRTWQRMHGGDAGESGTDDRMAAKSFEGVGAYILGRNMFGPVRGPWHDESWRGWWGEDPPYHTPVFVLTHFPRKPIPMRGGTEFHFVTEGIFAALSRAKEAATGLDVRIGGGVSTVRQYLQAGLIDELHLVQAAVLLGAGEPLFAGLDLRALGYRCTERISGERGTHVVLAKQS